MICVECGEPIQDTSLKLHSQVVLSRCEFCGEPADKYIEYETGLKILDLILHKPAAYRHFLFNSLPYMEYGLPPVIILLLLSYITIGGYLRYIEKTTIIDDISYYGIETFFPTYSYLCFCGAFLLEFVAFVGGVLLAVWFSLKEEHRQNSLILIKWNYFVIVTVLGSFGELLAVMQAIWPFKKQFKFFIPLFIITSNISSLKAFLGCNTRKSFAIVGFGLVLQTILILFSILLHGGDDICI